MKVGVQFRILPNSMQVSSIMQTFGCVRVMYNACIDAWTGNYQKWVEDGKPEGQFDNNLPTLKQLKGQHPWIADADSVAVTSAQMDFKQALNSYFKSKKGERKGKKVGFPKHKKRGKCRYSYRTCNQGGNIKFSDDKKQIKLPKLGWVDVIAHRPVPKGVIGRVYVSMNKAEEFYVSLNIDVEDTAPTVKKLYRKKKPKVVGLDMSLSKFCVSSNKADDAITKYVRNYREEEEHLKRLHRRLSGKKKFTVQEIDGKVRHVETSNHKKARLKLARAYLKVSRRRREFCIQMARYFAQKYDVICIEDLDMQAMSRTLHLGKSVMDLGWGMFCKWLEYECKKYDTVVIKADKWYPSSKTCNHCGSVNRDLSLSDREWVCPDCGSKIDRDRNAALNLRDYAIRKISSLGTWEVNDRGALSLSRETVSGNTPERKHAFSKTEGKAAA